jgi:hypothetical protein
LVVAGATWNKLEDQVIEEMEEEEPMVVANRDEADCGGQEQNHWQVEDGVAAGRYASSIAAAAGCVVQRGYNYYYLRLFAKDAMDQVAAMDLIAYMKHTGPRAYVISRLEPPLAPLFPGSTKNCDD